MATHEMWFSAIASLLIIKTWLQLWFPLLRVSIRVPTQVEISYWLPLSPHHQETELLA
jgi:hypothetical protein